MKRYLFISLFLLTSSAILQGQTRQAYLLAAESSFEEQNYYAALEYYQEVLEFREDIAVFYKAGEAARNFNSFTLAEDYYKEVVDLEQNAEYPLAMFHLATVQKQLGKYDIAKENFMIFQAESQLDNPYYQEAATRQMEDIDWALERIAESESYATIERLNDSINTPFSEFAPLAYGDTLIFSSLRFPLESDESVPKRIFSQVMASKDQDSAVAMSNAFNSLMEHTAHAVYTADKTGVYYTLCEYVNSTDIRCDIYYRSVNADGTYGEPTKLPAEINSPEYTNTQPALGLDPYGSQEVLYFVSDRMGGKGKLDIWFSPINADGSFGKPVNLMIVNTIDNDITPFFHRPSNTLYFSSDAYQGFGGYDIYSLYLNDLDNPEIQNLGLPLNSSYDDYYFSLDYSGEEAYLSSNRAGSAYIETDQEACCNDIYKAEILVPDINLKVLTYDKNDQSDLLGATVTLVEVNGEEKIVGTQTIGNTNEFPFDLEPNKSYLIIAQKDGYLSDTAMVSTKGMRSSEEITRKMYLEGTSLDLELLVFDDNTKEALQGATVRIKDLSDPDNEIIVQLNEEGNQFIFPLERGKNYEITVSRRGYAPETFAVDTDAIPGTRFTRKVYLKNGTLEDFLPLAVYFDNDNPNPRTYTRTTRLRYDETYPPYMSRKDEFKLQFAGPLVGNAKATAEDDIERFFEFDLRSGRDDLMRFIRVLNNELDNGQGIEIVIQGFASPRAPSVYNERLSGRRISSVVNQLRSYGNQALIDYLDDGKLTVVQEAQGEKTAPIYISDDIQDERNSIYSVPASRERRVEVIGIHRN